MTFLCTGNTCRAQMAEWFSQEHGNGLMKAYDACRLIRFCVLRRKDES
jgi:protein-tyrosine-phosphatase